MASSSVAVLSLCVVLNVLFSVVIVLLNKFIYLHFGFPNVTMSCLHLVFTTIGVCACHRLNVFNRRCLPIARPLLILSLSFCGFVTLTNLSLEYNTVGTYQLAKTLTSPLVIAIQAKYYAKRFSSKLLSTLVPIIVGVCLNTYADVKFSLLGTVYALVAVMVTSVYQVMVSDVQHKMQVNSLQLLYYQAPLSATVLVPVIVVTEPLFGERGLLSVWSYEALIMVGVSGLVAFGVNLTIFWLIGNTSPLTYNVVGHSKFCLTLLGGFILFRENVTLLQCVGILLTILGVVSYTVVNLQEGSQNLQYSEERRKKDRKHISLSIE